MKIDTAVFPTGLALGETFINRTQERKLLSQRIKNNQHTVLMAPRRYGKTSLVVKVSEEMDLPYGMIDLFSCDSEEELRDVITLKIGEFVLQLFNNLEEAKKVVFNVFTLMKPELVLGAFGVKLQITFSKNPAEDITKLLLHVNEVAATAGKKAIFLIKEFQQLSKLEKCHELEASIRHAVERSQHVTYIFSGSNKHLLAKMFKDDSRPFYKLCHTMELDRISPEHYIPYLKIHAKHRWKKELDEAQLQCIFSLTACHPFYINRLCQLIWSEEQFPETEMIMALWSKYVETQKHFFQPMIAQLSLNQRKMLKALANSFGDESLSMKFLSPLQLSTSSAQQSLEYLQKKCLIQRAGDGSYFIIDSAVKYFLLKNHY